MFRWSKAKQGRATSLSQKYRPRVELLEERELPALVVNVGPNIDVTQAVGNQREQSVAINPRNSNQVAIFANIEDITGDGAADDGVIEAWSKDGGQTWNTQFLFTDATLPEASVGDPQAAWDAFGNLYLTYIADNNGNFDVAVAISIDGGQTFKSRILTTDGNHDQPSIAVGPGPQPGTGTVWVSYHSDVSTLSPAPHIDVQCALVISPGVVGPFRAPVAVPGSDAVLGNFGDIAVGPNGQVIVTYEPTGTVPAAGPSAVYVSVDPDGLGPLPFNPRKFVTSSNVGPARIIPGTTNNFGIDIEPSLAWDRSNGPHRGRVYLVYTDATGVTGNDTNIFLRFSDNLGLTWSSAIRVNDDTGTGSQFNPAVAVDQSTGNLGIAWFDTRNDPANNRLYEMWATVSATGGASFQKNFKVSAGQSNASLADPSGVSGVRPLGVGDFNKIDFVRGNLQIVWADNSPGLIGNPDPNRMDVVTSRVRVLTPTQVRVYFPIRWVPISVAAGTYKGQLTIVNLTNNTLFGPFTLTVILPFPSLNFLSPANTRVGNTVTFTITGNLPAHGTLRFNVVLSNPLHKKLPTFLIGYVTSL